MDASADAVPLPVEPSLAEVRALARDHNLVPLRHTFIDDCETPVSAFLKLRGRNPEHPAFLLESAEQGQRVGRYSFIGVRPRSVLRWSLGDPGDPYALAAEEVGRWNQAPLPDLPPFSGGLVGYFGYDLVRTVEPLGDPNPDPVGLPDMALMLSDVLVVFDHLKHTITILVNVFAEDGGDLDAAHADAIATILKARTLLAGPVPRPDTLRAPRAVPAFTSNLERPQFEAIVARIIEYVHAGDAFQVVPSQRWSADVDADPFSIYRGLRVVNPSPYMYFLDFRDFQVAGASPEPLLTVSGRHVSTRPIAGTRPRGADAEEDAVIAAGLLRDEKERAEHVMLVDLGRNDLGRVCEYGSVQVDTLHGRRDLLARHAHRLVGLRDAARGHRPDGRAAQRPARRDAVRGAEGPCDADHRRARAGQARRLRRRDRLSRLHRRPRHVHPHPHGRAEGRARAHPGRRRHRRGRQARLRVRGVGEQGARGEGRDRARRDAGGLVVSATADAPRVLVIDNYDSFTYNLVQFLGELGADLEVVRNDRAGVDELLARRPDRVVVSPGPCTPNEAGISLEVVRRFPEAGIPTLGVCLGHQSLAQAFGGRVIRHEPVHGKTTTIRHDGRTIFRGLESPLTVGRYHSLVVAQDVPDCFEVSATGGGVVMAIRHLELPAEGVQFHPESVLTDGGMLMLESFLEGPAD